MTFVKGNTLYKLAKKPSLKERFEDKVLPEPNSGCWLWLGMVNNGGYGEIKCKGKEKAPQVRAHRVAWELYRGSVPEGLCVLHRCDTKLCVNPAHLFLGTHRDNNLDMRSKGRERPPSGEQHWNFKLTEDQVAQIRAADGTQATIAKAFGTHQSVISRIKNNKRRATVKSR